MKLAFVVVACAVVATSAIFLVRGREQGSATSSTPITEESTTTTAAPTTTTSSTTTTTTIPPYMPPGLVAPIGTGAPLPVISHIDTVDPVVFLTIDDGQVRDPRVVELIERFKIPATLFINEGPLRADPDYFKRVAAFGGSVNSHTRSHPVLTKLSFAQQREQICGMRNAIGEFVFVPGHFFRAPYGSLNDTTRNAAANCGMNAIFQWSATINDGVIRYARPGGLRAGDIVLTHFRPDLYDNIVALWWTAGAQGLRLASLDGYVPLAK